MGKLLYACQVARRAWPLLWGKTPAYDPWSPIITRVVVTERGNGGRRFSLGPHDHMVIEVPANTAKDTVWVVRPE